MSSMALKERSRLASFRQPASSGGTLRRALLLRFRLVRLKQKITTTVTDRCL